MQAKHDVVVVIQLGSLAVRTHTESQSAAAAACSAVATLPPALNPANRM
jgi:hypothetical protein